VRQNPTNSENDNAVLLRVRCHPPIQLHPVADQRRRHRQFMQCGRQAFAHVRAMRPKLEDVQLDRYAGRLQPNVELRRVARVDRLVSGSRVDKARARVRAGVRGAMER
jgi:hypothetical protein